MKSFTEIRDAIAAKLVGVDGVGVVQNFERYAKTTRDIKTFYVPAGSDDLDGCFIRRTGSHSVSPDDVTFTRTATWEIHYIRSWVDSEESGDAFDLLIDGLIAAFDADITLGGVVQTTKSETGACLQLMDNKPAMFAGHLVHYATLQLKTVDVYNAL